MKLHIRTVLGTLFLAGLTAGAWAQTPPVGARDITNLPASGVATTGSTTTPTQPSAQIAAPASVVRIYVDNISGTDASALTGLINQALFQSGQVVVTENQNNASVILKGTVTREALARARGTSRDTTTRKPAATPDNGSDSTLTPLPTFGADNSDVDLSRYRYRLNLRLVNPDGDLVWMSGQGPEALPYAAADSAVGQTLAPMFKALTALEHEPGH
ncbi:MAG TPA: hypothetical protein VN709_05330 [Terriglobales bacterium]|nr:hypothetical protein [Terriglobales bacterium]